MISSEELRKQANISDKDYPIIVAITKNQPDESLLSAYESGYRHFGESTLQGMIRTVQLFSDVSDVKFHFVGRLQSNKIKKLCQMPISMIHSVSKTSYLDLFDNAAKSSLLASSIEMP